MSQRQLRGTARARGEEVVDELQRRTQVKPREAGLVEASVLVNVMPDIQSWPGRCGGRERQDIDRSYYRDPAEWRIDSIGDQWNSGQQCDTGEEAGGAISAYVRERAQRGT